MNRKKLQSRIESDQELLEKIRDYSSAFDESEQNSRELWVTIWKDGRITASLTQRGSDYPPETYRAIDAVITLPRVTIYEDFDIDAELEKGIHEDELQDVAIQQYKDNFDLSRYLDEAEKSGSFDKQNEFP